jgi:hypothetical protein
MHITPSLIFVVFAFVLAAIAAIFAAPVEPYRLKLVAAALAFYFLSILVAGVSL